MRDPLAERLLAEVMGWTPEDIARERPDLQAMAAYKYDDYQQFAPGMRFIESLASWLGNLDKSERDVAYEFVKRRLLYCSVGEMNHLVAMAYEDYIRPLLIHSAADDVGCSPRHVAKIVASQAFQIRRRRCLFLGLSDGARTDIFRRHTSDELSPEQIRMSHEIAEERAQSLLDSLRSDLTKILKQSPPDSLLSFRTLVLLDDFSASGLSYLRKKNGKLEGKIGSLHRELMKSDSSVSRLLDSKQRDLVILLYMATQQAQKHLSRFCEEIWDEAEVRWSIKVVNPVPDSVRITPGAEDPMEPIIEAHYDAAIETSDSRIGGTDLKYGFAGGGLPLVMAHNTPNNSIALIWAKTASMRPLFPRVSRFREKV